MKKKIKEITQSDINKICKKNFDKENGCCGLNCPILSKDFDFIDDCSKFEEAKNKYIEKIEKEVDYDD